MKYFLFEFITGGGLIGESLSNSLVREATHMLQTLIDELNSCCDAEVIITRDHRVEPFKGNVSQHVIDSSYHDALIKFIKESDVSCLIAPETNNYLYNLSELFIKNAKTYIGSDLKSVELTSSKLKTNKTLMSANIHTPETVILGDDIPDSKLGWVVKPDDGVGAQDCCYFKSKSEIKDFLTKNNDNYVVQPYLNGENISISVLVYKNRVKLLSCNKLEIKIKNKLIYLDSIIVNEYLSYKNEMRELAENVVECIPGFSGYIGIDLIRSNEKLFVIDINPRFTTSLVGISESLGVNVTEKILKTFLTNEIQDINIENAIPVKIKLL